MSISQMREAIKKVYMSDAWDDRVDKMSDKQVYATYMRMLNNKEL